jgi:predicted kinase
MKKQVFGSKIKELKALSKLILVMGLPGSGKSTYASACKGVKIHIDEVRKSLTGSYVPGDNDDLVYQTVRHSVDYYLKKGRTVVLDGALLSKKARAPFLQIAKRYITHIEVHWLDVSKTLLEMRLMDRNQSVPNDRKIEMSYVENLHKVFEMPTKDEGIDLVKWITDTELLANEFTTKTT